MGNITRVLHISDLSHWDFLTVFSYLNAYDLYNLSKTCRRFRYLICKFYKWKMVNLLNHSICANKFKHFYKYLNKHCNVLMVKGLSENVITCDAALLQNSFIFCNNLTILSLEYQCVDTDQITIQAFPVSLKELSLRRTGLTGNNDFLNDIHKRLINLHTLILDGCKWLTFANYNTIARLPKLENLSLCFCKQLDRYVYAFTPSHHDYPTLRRLDIRLAECDANAVLRRVVFIPTLQELYLEAVTTYAGKHEKFKRLPKWYKKSVVRVNCVQMDCECTISNCASKFYKQLVQPASRQVVTTQLTQEAVAFFCRSGRNQGFASIDEPELSETKLFVKRYKECHCSPDDITDSDCPDLDDNNSLHLVNNIAVRKKCNYRKQTQKRRQMNEARFHHQQQQPQQPVVAAPRLPTDNVYMPENHLYGLVEQELNTKPSPALRVLCLRGFYTATDQILQLISASRMPLQILDLTGANFSDEAVRQYQFENPETHLIYHTICKCAPLPL